ncbi:hypothetical protein [Methanobrevibacter sp.]|uniref:hypothetical protein n=1 Tax=Methanobrevibacter sp. TaxID=66852 RepID=UPI00388D0507
MSELNKKEKIVIVLLIIIIIILIGAILSLTIFDSDNLQNNTTVVNTTNTTLNATFENATSTSSSQYSDSSQEDEPEYGTDEYVDKWDESQQSGSDWSYLHDQPVKTDDDGNRYKRMYDEDSGESYWFPLDQDYEE